ncbi:Hemolysin-type calcium-binding repeat-containing protein [Poseidonocella pacifica]|uniref:Hemolysin-type calcium-binding repeat-containing protein n=1 Tax=Poseidonocella pacifica TaxID=871651 RepID=A0A1I0YPR1_9RHOB|nr:calcium-binding protein [Poseidonocella pacifica]SFB14450.1 Hemolysin-type calcium-binding repeat-containing protein [Poseidonocella pacifica]
MKIDLQLGTAMIGTDHFGSNYLADRHFMEQSIEGSGGFKSAASSLGITNLRYPGGTLSEKYFDLSDDRHISGAGGHTIDAHNFHDPDDVTQITPLADFLKYASEENASVTVVIPTARYFEKLTDGSADGYSQVKHEIQSFITSIFQSEFGGQIAQFEIGNEFGAWIDGHAGDIFATAEDYAYILRNFSVWIDEALTELNLADDPDIIGQAAFFEWGDKGNNLLINSFLDTDVGEGRGDVASVADAVAALDGISVHSYTTATLENYDERQNEVEGDLYLFEMWDERVGAWTEASGESSSELRRVVTEWNQKNSAFQSNQISGSQAAIGLISQFHHLVSSGVDELNVWPALQTSQNSLIRGSGEQQTLTYSGAAFALLRNLTNDLFVLDGGGVLDFDEDGVADAVAYFFGDADRVVGFISAFDTSWEGVSLDVAVFGLNMATASASLVSLHGNTLDNLDASSQPVLTSYTSPKIETGGIFEFDLMSWDTAILTLDLKESEVGALISGSATSELSFSLEIPLSSEELRLIQHHDGALMTLVGTETRDTIQAVQNFIIDASEGHDTVYGSSGSDYIFGNAGNDEAFGFSGNDVLWGGAGDDILDGGLGQDILSGGSGNDVLYSTDGTANDKSFGGLGDDTFYFDSSADILDGGEDNDRFFHQGSEFYAEEVVLNASSSAHFGTGQYVDLSGKMVVSSFIIGGEGYDTVFLSDESTALILDASALSVALDPPSGVDARHRFDGIEEIQGGAGDDVIDLTSYQEVSDQAFFKLYGGDGDDVIWGTPGMELIDGGDGNDILFGGAGGDTLSGGSGADTFQFTLSSGRSTITDFDPFEGDRIQVFHPSGVVQDLEARELDGGFLDISMLNNEGDIVHIYIDLL